MTVVPKQLGVGSKLSRGRYLLRSLLYQGELEFLYRGICASTGQSVWARTLNPQLCNRPDFAQLHFHFRAVAERLRRCQHPNLVKVLDIFEEDGFPYMVLAEIPGQTLKEFQPSSPPSLPQAVHFIKQVASALTAIHRQGLLHCNLHPGAIIQRSETSLVVLDQLGLTSELAQSQLQSPTRNRNLVGGYAAIEQYLPHEPLSPATDVYGLTAIFYTLLTGQPPLEAPLCISQATRTLLDQSKPQLNQLYPALSPDVESLINWGLELEQHRRPQTVHQWISRLLQETESPTTISSPTTGVSSPHQTQSHQSVHPGRSQRENSTAQQNYRLPARQSSVMGFVQPLPWGVVSGLFAFTALISGWLGFSFTRYYSCGLTEATPKRQQQSDDVFQTLDSSKPMFRDPSVVRQRNQPKFRVESEEGLERDLEDADWDVDDTGVLELDRVSDSPYPADSTEESDRSSDYSEGLDRDRSGGYDSEGYDSEGYDSEGYGSAEDYPGDYTTDDSGSDRYGSGDSDPGQYSNEIRLKRLEESSELELSLPRTREQIESEVLESQADQTLEGDAAYPGEAFPIEGTSFESGEPLDESQFESGSTDLPMGSVTIEELPPIPDLSGSSYTQFQAQPPLPDVEGALP
ncbi:MAG: protein kinase [Microcoleaceae cyanobacterium]